MAGTLSLTTDAGAPVIDNQHSQTAGPGAHRVFEVTSPDVPRWRRHQVPRLRPLPEAGPVLEPALAGGHAPVHVAVRRPRPRTGS